ncbi:TPA: transposase [Klebsiella pneumoniae]|nr:transposase [Klebsiella pneumoniae]
MGSCAAPSAKGDDKFITTDYLQQCPEYNSELPHESLNNLTPEEYRLMAETPGISKSAWN